MSLFLHHQKKELHLAWLEGCQYNSCMAHTRKVADATTVAILFIYSIFQRLAFLHWVVWMQVTNKILRFKSPNTGKMATYMFPKC